MSDTLTEIRARDEHAGDDLCSGAADRRALVAHIDALTAAVHQMEQYVDADKRHWVPLAAVLAILGETE